MPTLCSARTFENFEHTKANNVDGFQKNPLALQFF